MLKIIENKKIWEDFLLKQSYQPFFQSWNWGEIQEKLGHKITKIGIYKDNKLIGICLVIEIKAKRGNYLHLRHGPLLANFRRNLTGFLRELKELAGENIDFIRMSAPLDETFDSRFLKKLGFRPSPIHNMDAENAWVLDLGKSEDELLRQMRKTTRYLIKKGEKSGLEVIRGNDKKDIKEFLKLYKKTATKHGFVPHRGIEEEFSVFRKDNQVELFLVKFKKRVISGAIVIYYGNQAIYHHGATDPKFEHLSPSYLVQWEAIKEAKRRNKKVYNFWGVVPPDKPNHPWQGLTLFKMGFGGRRINFIHSQDLPLKSSYWRTFLIESIIRMQKGY